MRLTCTRTRLDSNGDVLKEWTETHVAMLSPNETCGERWIYLVPGVTGYESVSVKDLFNRRNANKGWLACSGFSGKWDRLFVPADEMERLKDVLRLTLPLAQTIKDNS